MASLVRVFPLAAGRALRAALLDASLLREGHSGFFTHLHGVLKQDMNLFVRHNPTSLPSH